MQSIELDLLQVLRLIGSTNPFFLPHILDGKVWIYVVPARLGQIHSFLGQYCLRIHWLDKTVKLHGMAVMQVLVTTSELNCRRKRGL